MPIIRSNENPAYSLPGLHVVGLAAPSRGARETAAWRLRLEPGVDGAAHSVDREEIFIALVGSAVATLGAESTTLRAGDTFIVPVGQVFSLSNPTSEPFEAIAMAPVGLRAKLADGEAFAPPWTQ
jgi:mannose-6-phosphate isomerase-like protein (cupin superfamily)